MFFCSAVERVKKRKENDVTLARDIAKIQKFLNKGQKQT